MAMVGACAAPAPEAVAVMSEYLDDAASAPSQPGASRRYVLRPSDGSGAAATLDLFAARNQPAAAQAGQPQQAGHKITTFALPVSTDGGAVSALGPGNVVAIVQVTPPWYAPGFLIRRTMNKRVAEYAVLPDLIHKAFAIGPDGRVGGIYLWRDRSSANAFYNDAWHALMRDRYGENAEIRWFDVINTQLQPEA